jgi:hypothetical protein
VAGKGFPNISEGAESILATAKRLIFFTSHCLQRTAYTEITTKNISFIVCMVLNAIRVCSWGTYTVDDQKMLEDIYRHEKEKTFTTSFFSNAKSKNIEKS